MKDVLNISTNELMIEFFKLQQQLNLQIIQYNLIIDELVKRFPNLEKDENFEKRGLK